jgi:hypothetical protein
VNNTKPKDKTIFDVIWLLHKNKEWSWLTLVSWEI